MILDLSKKVLRSLICAASVLALGNASYAVAEETIGSSGNGVVS